MNRKTACLLAAAVVQAAALAQTPRVIQFSGYSWTVKSSSGKVGPGPNFFSDSTNNVWVDSSGQLHLKITQNGVRWQCAEVTLNASFGYGTYRFYLASPVDNLDPNVVLGLFTWSDDPEYNNRELDVEFSRWGRPNNQNAQYVVQPSSTPGNLFRWNEPAGLAQTTHSLIWQEPSATFTSLNVWSNQTPPDPPAIVAQHEFSSGLPVPGGENIHMNLWLYQGNPPRDRMPAEVVISKFEYRP